jgi:nitrite reductase (NO-forming)
VLLAGLSTGHKVGLGVVAIVFIGFALTSSFLAPRRRADFPGKNGLSVFVLAAFVLFLAMIGAVVVFGSESEAKGAGNEAAAGQAPVAGHVVKVQEKEFKITLASKSVPAGAVTFTVTNVGKIQHDLAIQGGSKTALISPGKTAKLSATLKKGTVTLYCSVPGHRQLGMVTKLTVT